MREAMGATIGRPEKARGRRGRVRSGATRVGTRKAGRIRSVLCPPIDPSAAVSGSTASEARSQPGRERGPHTHATRRREPDPDGDATRDGDPTGQMFVKRLHAPFLERTCACAPVSCGCAFVTACAWPVAQDAGGRIIMAPRPVKTAPLGEPYTNHHQFHVP